MKNGIIRKYSGKEHGDLLQLKGVFAPKRNELYRFFKNKSGYRRG